MCVTSERAESTSRADVSDADAGKQVLQQQARAGIVVEEHGEFGGFPERRVEDEHELTFLVF